MEIATKNIKIEYLRNLAYNFYPSDIDAISDQEKYKNSNEFHTLKKSLNSNYETIKDLNLFFKNYENKNFTFRDCTNLRWMDRCLNFNFFQINKTNIESFCYNISLLIPYYTIYKIKIPIDSTGDKIVWTGLPYTSDYYSAEIENEIKFISSFLEFNFINKKELNVPFENINFQDISMGKFSLFQAFFLNEIIFY
jgi:hypothetical protein